MEKNCVLGYFHLLKHESSLPMIAFLVITFWKWIPCNFWLKIYWARLWLCINFAVLDGPVKFLEAIGRTPMLMDARISWTASTDAMLVVPKKKKKEKKLWNMFTLLPLISFLNLITKIIVFFFVKFIVHSSLKTKSCKLIFGSGLYLHWIIFQNTYVKKKKKKLNYVKKSTSQYVISWKKVHHFSTHLDWSLREEKPEKSTFWHSFRLELKEENSSILDGYFF